MIQRFQKGEADMTIKEFSKLCGCNPQTLRYYDRENLLKPVNVDEWSGYRFYDEEQAIIYVKIKNLQKAGFSIEEIKELLQKSDSEIFYAFDVKIAEEEKRIQEIKNIQKAYQTEVTIMKDKIEKIRELLRESMREYNPAEEFGLEYEGYVGMIEEAEALFDQMIRDGDFSRFEFNDYADEEEGADEQYFESCLHNPAYEVIFEKHNWTFVKEFYNELPKMNQNDGYLLLFRVVPEKVNKTAFANTIIGMCMKRADCRLKIGCTVIDSKDASNHFWLVKYEDMD